MYDNQEYVSNSLRVGASGYVLKDAPSREIIAAIEVLSVGGQFYSGEIAQKLASGETEEHELTPRERQVLLMMAQGLNNKAMARELQISVRTVETHRLSIRRKLDIEKPADLVKHAREHGWSPE
ncbi:Oxygen regulatory protein NreC [compost metagenome]